MRLKKTVALALVTAMAATMTAGCGGSSDKGSAAPETTAAGSEAAGSEAAESKETEAAASGEKQKLTVEDLLEKFAQASGGAFANDRMLLSK